jgi:hypothetical protein
MEASDYPTKIVAMPKYPKIDLTKVKTYSIDQRPSKISSAEFAQPHQPGASFASFFDSLPQILKAKDLHEFVDRIVAAYQKGKPVLFMMGAHVIKVGLSPVIIDLMERRVITCVAMNGAGVIHDIEIAYFGQTSEDVAVGLEDGSFGMVQETAELINSTVQAAKGSEMGFGEAVGARVVEDAPPNADKSILGRAYELDVPVTVHVAIGTDIVHQHPGADGGAIGELSFNDFRILAHQIAGLGDGGVVLNIGSNVLLPEVFLKALTVARNIHGDIRNFTTANFDMIQHYRPGVNVVQRPVLPGGKGYQFTGHHEIMLPLLAAVIVERLG